MKEEWLKVLEKPNSEMRKKGIANCIDRCNELGVETDTIVSRLPDRDAEISKHLINTIQTAFAREEELKRSRQNAKTVSRLGVFIKGSVDKTVSRLGVFIKESVHKTVSKKTGSV